MWWGVRTHLFLLLQVPTPSLVVPTLSQNIILSPFLFPFSSVLGMLGIPLTTLSSPASNRVPATFILTRLLFMISPLMMLQHSEKCEFEIHWENAPLYYTLVLKEKKWVYLEFPSFSSLCSPISINSLPQRQVIKTKNVIS